MLLYNVSKIDIYTYAYKQGRLPRYALVYIGQKKNLRLYDLETGVYQTVNAETLRESLPWEYCLDDVEAHSLYAAVPRANKISLSYADTGITFEYAETRQTITMKDLGIAASSYLIPNYMMDPTIG
ncbi:MAG: hypothetical protein H6765_02585 [Candidatus Peribacteria bacterium]|nr:MAG: hypothetical protein H6765_02585 [Candidatus Peribacteria bacterium]